MKVGIHTFTCLSLNSLRTYSCHIGIGVFVVGGGLVLVAPVTISSTAIGLLAILVDWAGWVILYRPKEDIFGVRSNSRALNEEHCKL